MSEYCYVAKTYENLTRMGNPYTKNGRWYTLVKTTAGPKEVRLYNKPQSPNQTAAPAPVWNARKGFGFGDAGFITIFKGEISCDDEYFSRSDARYCMRWGWYFVSDDVVPDDIPYYAEAKKLLWSAVGNDNNGLKDEKAVRDAVNALIFGESNSEYVGAVGDRLDDTLTVVKISTYENQYGVNTIHDFKDVDGNVYRWSTAAKSWAEGTAHHIRGTVKEHKTINGVKTTVLTRCTEVKE